MFRKKSAIEELIRTIYKPALDVNNADKYMTATELLGEFIDNNKVQFNNMHQTQIDRVLTSMNFPTKKVKSIKKYALDLVKEDSKSLKPIKKTVDVFPFSSNGNQEAESSKELPF